MYVKQCDCLKPCLWTTTFVDDRTSLIHYTFFIFFENEALFNIFNIATIISETKWSMAAAIVNIGIA
jgi:hypothetical protein